MGVVGEAGWCVVSKRGDVLARRADRAIAERIVRRLRGEGQDVYLAQLFYSDGLLEKP